MCPPRDHSIATILVVCATIPKCKEHVGMEYGRGVGNLEGMDGDRVLYAIRRKGGTRTASSGVD